MAEKLERAVVDGDVALTVPAVAKSIHLRFIENLMIINDPNARKRTPQVKSDTLVLGKVLEIFHDAVVLIDEVDWVLHPLKSELNFPVGQKQLIDFATQRWDLPLHLLKAMFFAKTPDPDPLPQEWRNSAEAHDIVKKLAEAVQEGVKNKVVMTQPHTILLDEKFYKRTLRPLLARWLKLFLDMHHVGRQFKDVQDCGLGLSTDEVLSFIREASHSEELAQRVLRLPEQDIRMLNLSRDWIHTFLPHNLRKINCVSYGLMSDQQWKNALQENAFMSETSHHQQQSFSIQMYLSG
jgi:hypothetical protein